MTPPTLPEPRPTPTGGPPIRLTELATDDPQLDAEVRRAGALLRQLPKPAPLSASTLARIEDRIAQRTAQPALSGLPWLRRLGWGSVAMATVAASFAIGWGLRPRSLPPQPALPELAQRAADLREVSLPGGSQARLLTQHGAVLDFSGPGRLTLAVGDITLSDGQLHIESAASSVTVRVGSRRVSIPAGGSAQVRVQLGELVYVAAFRGAVSVASTATDADFQNFTVPAGGAWPAQDSASPSASAVPPPAGSPSAVASPAARTRPRPARPLAPSIGLSPAPEPAAPTPTAAPVGDASLLAESQLLGQALQRLHREHDPRGALTVLDAYRTQFQDGRLRDEAQAARVDALIQLDRRDDALQILDGAALPRLARGNELRLLRGELRAHAGRCREALGDFSATWQAEQSRDSENGQRALYGLATCRLSLGERGLARDALRQYLDRYPAGRFSDAARDALSRLQ